MPPLLKSPFSVMSEPEATPPVAADAADTPLLLASHVPTTPAFITQEIPTMVMSYGMYTPSVAEYAIPSKRLI